MKKILLTMVLMLTSLMSTAADNKQNYVPSSYGGWQNLSAIVNDITYYISDPLPMQAAVLGKTVHVFWSTGNPMTRVNTASIIVEAPMPVRRRKLHGLSSSRRTWRWAISTMWVEI